MDQLTFADVQAAMNKNSMRPFSLLLGNGFSMSYAPDIFSYNAPQACNPMGAGTPACRISSEMTDLFAFSGNHVYATANGDNLLRFDGTAWSRVTTLPPTSLVRDLTAVFGGVTPSGANAVYVAAKTGRSLDLLFHDGTRWIGPVVLTTFDTAQAANFALRDIGGCSPAAPILVGSVQSGTSRKGLVLTPLTRLVP